MGHAFLRFLTQRLAHPFVSWSGSLFASRLSTAWCRVLGSQVTDQSWPLIFRAVRLQQRDHSFEYPLCFPSFAIMALCRNVLQEDDILLSYMWIHFLKSLIIVAMKVWTVTMTSPQLVLINKCDLLLIHWPHNFHTYFSSNLSRQFHNSLRLAQTMLDRNFESLRHCEGWQGQSTWPRRGKQALKKREFSVPEECWLNGASVEGQDLCEW